MKRYLFLTILLFLGHPIILFAQEKLEEERRIKPALVPQDALAFIETLNPQKKIRWFEEKSHLGITVESKFKHQNHLHSIEFDDSGSFLDMEIKVDAQQLPINTLTIIQQFLDTKFHQWKYIKIQLQYSGSIEDITQVFNAPIMTTTPISPKYEIVIKGKTDKGIEHYEFLFNNNGILIEQFLIPSRNVDHLEF